MSDKNEKKGDDQDSVEVQDASSAIAGKESAQDKGAGHASAHETTLGNDITIYTNDRLPEYDNGVIKAYRGAGRGNIPDHVVVYACEDALSPRTNVGANYNKIINPNLVRLVASGVVYWPNEKRYRYVLVYEQNLGRPIVESDFGAYGWDHDKVLSTVLTPMVGLLLDFRDKEFVHGNIRPSNLFDGASPNLERIVLGECLSQPAWCSMPAVYMSIEKAMTDPYGRGRGAFQEDLYSLGVTLSVLMRNTNPLKDKTDDQIIAEKIQHGSYQALTGKDRFTGPVLELLRGLLIDDMSQRWTLEEVEAWMDGRRLSPKQTSKRLKANRPIMLMGKKYIYPELLAMDMAKHVNEAAHIVNTDELDQWLERAIDNKALIERVEKLKASASDAKGGSIQQMIVTHICMALHPEAPVRYKKSRFLPEGMGTALTHAYVTKDGVQDYVDVLMNYIASKWVDNNETAFIDVVALLSKFEHSKNYLKQKASGFGIERCIYYLDPCAPCFSDKVKDYYVRNPEDIMSAFEHISQKPDRPYRFFDRHIVAFLSVKDRSNIDPYFYELSHADSYQNVLGELKTLATIQKRSKLGFYPGIASWISDNLSDVYKHIHDREKADKIQKQVKKLVDKGDITKIAALFDDPHMFSNDKGYFFEAMRQFQKFNHEEATLNNELENNKHYGYDVGKQVAAVVSCIIASIAILISSFLAVSSMLGG